VESTCNEYGGGRGGEEPLIRTVFNNRSQLNYARIKNGLAVILHWIHVLMLS